jgi:hypothetical protein
MKKLISFLYKDFFDLKLFSKKFFFIGMGCIVGNRLHKQLLYMVIYYNL